MAALDLVKDELRRRGHDWYFLGNPSVLEDSEGQPAVRYWLNGIGGRDYPQPYGWYTEDELLAEKFADDARERKRERERERLQAPAL